MRVKWLNAILLAAIFLGMMPFSVQAAPLDARPTPAIEPIGAGDEPPPVTVEPGLQGLAPDDETGYLIYLREKPDLSAAYEMDWETRGQYVVKQLQAAAARSQADVLAHLDAQGVSYQAFWIDNVIVVDTSPARTINQLTAFPEIASIREKREMIVYEPTVEENHLHSPGAIEPNLTHVLADQVWDLGYRGEGLVVANIDTGVRATHEALVRQYRGIATGSHDYNWLGAAGGSATPVDDHGHGTHTMGTMVGEDAASANRIGMAPGAQWIACDGCEGTNCPDAALLTCAQWVAAPYPVGDPSSPDPTKRPHVVNNSWGDCERSYDGWYQASVDAWLAAGIYPVFSNGNASNCSYSSPPGLNTVGNPARYGNVTGVGSTGQSNGLYAPHSNWGPTDNPDTVNPKPGWEGLKPQVLAPGVNIRSSVPGSDTAYQGGWNGTSMSAPHVTGLIALMWQAAPCLMGDYAATETIIEDTATPVPYDDGTGGGATVPNQATGWGEIDALAAVNQAIAFCGDSALQGNVTDADTGLPIEGARVDVLVDGSAVRTRLTDAQGDYSISLVPGTYSVDASKYGYETATFPSVTLTEAMTTTLDVSMTALPAYTVAGTVTDATTGWPLHARIFTDRGEESWSDPVTGRYSLTLFGTHPYTLTAMSWAAGYQPFVGAVGPLTGDVQLDIGLEAALACTAPGYRLTNGVYEQFEAEAFPPPGWTVVNNGGDCVWRGDDPGRRGNLTGAGGKFAMADSDACGSGTTMDTDLLSPAVDLSDLEAVTVAFAYDYRHLSSGSAQVDISADGGGTWTNLVTWTADARGPATFSQDVTALVAGSTEVQLRFRFVSPGWYWWWAIDDVVLGDPLCVVPTAGGLAVGHVYDANTGAPLAGALLDSAEDDAVSDLNGFYSLYGVGTQDVTASLSGYADAVEGVTFADGDVVPHDFELTAGRLVPTPGSLAATLTLGENAKQWLSLDNQGALDAAYRLVEIPGGYVPTGSAGSWMIRGSGVTDLGGGGAVSWLSESPMTGTVAAGTGEDVLVTFDASVPEVAAPGVYYAQLRVETDTPYGASTVPVTMTVDAPETWGKLDGVVQSLGYCDLTPTAAEAATVAVEASTGMTWSRLTDPDGIYELWLDARHSPLTLTVSYDDHVTAVITDVVVVDEATTTVDVGLRSIEPCVRVMPDSVHMAVRMGFTATDAITIGNGGAEATDFTLVEFDGGMLPSSVTPIAATVPDNVITFGDGPILTHNTRTDLVPTPSDSARPAGTHMLTHSISQTILYGNSVHCGSGGIHADNSYLRVFHLPDFGIYEDFSVTNVQVGIEAAGNGPQPATLNLYTLDGALTWANLTLIGSADVTIADQTLTVYNIPVTAEVPRGSTLVVELFTPAGTSGSYSLYVGSNNLGQTAPTYLAAADCGASEPADVAALGFPGMHLVMNVTGETVDPLPIPWLSEDPETGSVDADDQAIVALTFDATSAITQVTAPGDYFATLRVDTSDAQNGMISVPVTMTVLPPESWGKVNGVVHSLGYCDAMTDTLDGAEVRIEAADGVSWTLTTDADGAYQAWVDETHSPVTVTVSALEHEGGEALSLVVTGGAETTTDFYLRWLKPCVTSAPKGVHATLELGATASDVLTLTNTGAVGTNWALTEEHLGAPTGTPLDHIYDLNESFEGAFPPPRWGLAQTATPGLGWERTSLQAYSGSYSAYHDDPSGDSSAWLIMPRMTIPAGGADLVFWQRARWSSWYEYHGIWISTATDDPGDFVEWVELGPGTDGVWEKIVLSVDPYAGQDIYIAFLYEGNFADEWYIDDVAVELIDPVIWLTETPVSGVLAADTGEQVVAVDFDAAVPGIDQPGDYLASLRIDSDDPYAPTSVPVTMTVTAPATWGELRGTVTSLGRCDAEPDPLEGADVVVWDAAAATAVVTVTTDVDGAYSYWLPTGDYTVTVTAAEHVGDAYRVTVPASGVVTRDFGLRSMVPCLDGIAPSSMEVTVAMGVSTTLPLTMSNAGAGELTFSFHETNGGVIPTLMLSLEQAVQASSVVWNAQKLEGECAVYKDSILAEPPDALGCYDSVPTPQTFTLQPLAPTDLGYAQDIGYISENFVGFALNDFAGQTAIGTSTNAYYGMDFDPDATTLYALNDTTGELGTIDLTTGAFTGLVACPPGGSATNWTGLTIDPVAGTFYASTATHLYTIDPTTGASTLVGPFGTSLMIDIAMNSAGEIYGHDIGTDTIYRIDPATGAAASVGPTGYDANFAQGMDFDNQDGTLYIFLYQGSGANVYGTVDLTTGAVTPLAVSTPQGEFEGATQTREIGDILWLFQDPAAGGVPPMTDGVADITFDASVPEVTQPGAYYGVLTVNNSDPVWDGHTIPVTMNVTLPETYGQITGTVLGLGPCDDPLSTTPLEGAHVMATSASRTWSLSTDAEGGYALWLDEAQGPVTITVHATGYIPDLITDVVVISGTTTVIPDFLLRPDTPCFAGVTPADAHVTLAMGMSTTMPLTVANTGAGALDWTVSRAYGGFAILAADSILVVNDGGMNGTAVMAFTTALDNLGYAYDVVASSPATGIPAILTDYAAVVYAGIPSSGAEADQLIAYLDAGGHLLVADNDFGYSMRSHILYTDYFQSTYVSDAGSDGPLTGLDIMAGIDPDISADPYPDDFIVGAEGTCVFEAPSANCAGVAVDRLGYRGVYLAWDFQYSDGRQDDILDVAVPWLTGAVPWLDLDPTTGAVAPDSTSTLTATFDAGVPEVTQPGDYYAALTFKGAGAEFVVPVTMTVTAPDTWGKLEGVVQGLGYCDAAPEPLEGAVVFIESAVTAGTPVSHTLTTDADGTYGIWLDEVHSPFTVTVSYEAGYEAQVFSGVAISATQITTLDADLRWYQPCVSFLPEEGIAVTLDMGTESDEVLTLVNAGLMSATFSLGEQDRGFTPAAVQPAAATDDFGYTMTDSGEPLGPVFDFVDISGFGASLGLGDDEAVAVALPFDFNYYGDVYTEVYVSSNGLLSFGAAVTNFLNASTMPTSTLPNSIVATMWDDLMPGAAGKIFTHSFDRCPYGNGACAIVQYDSYEHADGASAGTWQAILFRNGSILMQYADAGDKRGATSTTGMEDFSGTDGLLFAANQPDALYDELAICFAFPGRATDCVDYDVPWLDLSTLSGNIAGDADTDVTLHFDAGVPEAEQPGEYLATVTLLSDDPVSPWYLVPVTMTVVRPATVGTITADVYGWNLCDVAALPMEGALIIAEGAGGASWSTTTDANGAFRLHIDEGHSPITLTLTYDGYVREVVADVAVVGGETTDLGDLFLRTDAPCIGVDPHAIDVTLTQGHVLTRELTLMNMGAAMLHVSDVQGEAWLTSDMTSGTVDPDDQRTLNLTFDTAGMSLGAHHGELVILSDGPMMPELRIPVTMTVRTPTLQVEKTAEPARDLFPGDAITYTLVLTNTSDGPLSVDVRDAIPANTVYAPGSTTGGLQYIEDAASRYMSWHGELAPDAVKTFTFAVIVDRDYTWGEITNAATIDFAGQQISADVTVAVRSYTLQVVIAGQGGVTATPDAARYRYGDEVTLTATPDTGWTFAGWSGDATGTDETIMVTLTRDLVVTATFDLPSALYVMKSVAPAEDLDLGETVTYTLDLVNNGGGAALGALLTDALPAGVTFDAFVVNEGGAEEADGTITWRGDLDQGETLTIVFTATVNDDATLCGPEITNTVSFVSDNAGDGAAEATFRMKRWFKVFFPLFWGPM